MTRIISVLFVVLGACTGNHEASSIAEDVGLEFFAQKLNDEVLLLDVRTPSEYKAGSIAGAINIDIQSASFTDEIAVLNKDKPVLLYCRSGMRSAKAMAIMKKKGFQELYNLKGGYLAWREYESR